MNIELEKDGEGPVYRQLADRIIRLIREEQVLGGEKLPPERELADKLALARGTVKKAYELVEQAGLVRIVHGKGTFVLAEEDPATGSRKDQAQRIIGDALNRLDALRFSLPEIGSMVQVMIMERERRLSCFHIAFVDCNPEALAIFEKQILYISRMQIHKYLLDEVAAMENPEEVFSSFDLILTTTTHYAELADRIPGQKQKLLQAAVSPDRQTISELAAIPRKGRVRVLFRSERFYRIISSWLDEFGITEGRIRKQPYSLAEDGRSYDFPPVAPDPKRGSNMAEGSETPEWIIIPPDLPLSVAAQAVATQSVASQRVAPGAAAGRPETPEAAVTQSVAASAPAGVPGAAEAAVAPSVAARGVAGRPETASAPAKRPGAAQAAKEGALGEAKKSGSAGSFQIDGGRPKSSPESTMVERETRSALAIIPFRYMIQRGSIIHIEERISRILDEGEHREGRAGV